MKINPNSLEAYKLFHEGTLSLCRAEQTGIRIDVDYCENQKIKITEQIEQLESAFKSTVFFKQWQKSSKAIVNIHSNTQLAHFLYQVKNIQATKTTKSGGGSSDEEALSQLNIPEINDLLRIRKLKKLKDTYIEGLIREQVKGFIHPFFNLHLVKTYRSSSDSPNFQNMPKRDKESMSIIRNAFYARKGHQLLAADFSGIEVRIAACYHKDPTMIKYIEDPTTDMHGDMASQIFKIKKFDRNIPEYKVLRNATKNGFVFPQFYGDYYKNCAINLACNWGKLPEGKWKPGMGIPMPNGTLSDHMINSGINGLPRFTDHIQNIEEDFWQNRFPVYKLWKEKWWAQYQKLGYIDTLTNFRCSGKMGKNDSINYPVQGSAFHCLLWSLITIDHTLIKQKLGSRIIGQIHDEIILDIHPNELEIVKNLLNEIMTIKIRKEWPWIIVPLEVEMEVSQIDGSWASMSKLNLHN